MSTAKTKDKEPETYPSVMANCWERVCRIPSHLLLESLSWVHSELELLSPENYDYRQQLKTRRNLLMPPDSTIQELRFQLWLAYGMLGLFALETGGARK